MGIVVDPAFATNRHYYTCQAYRGTGHRPIDIRVMRWIAGERRHVGYSRRHPGHHRPAHQLAAATAAAALRFDTTGTPARRARATRRSAPTHRTSTRSGARRCGSTRDGTAPSDNPFYSRGGHGGLRLDLRAPQRPGPRAAARARHRCGAPSTVPTATTRSTCCRPGATTAGTPCPGYNESVPMTDPIKFPDAIPATMVQRQPDGRHERRDLPDGQRVGPVGGRPGSRGAEERRRPHPHADPGRAGAGPGADRRPRRAPTAGSARCRPDPAAPSTSPPRTAAPTGCCGSAPRPPRRPTARAWTSHRAGCRPSCRATW